MTNEILVTGGGGFLGLAVCKALVKAGFSVRSYSRGAYPTLSDFGIKHYQGDICDYEALKKAASGCVAVVHTAAKAGVWGRWEDYERINVRGTQNCIKVIKDLDIRNIVYTSTPSVVFDGSSIEGGDEELAHSCKDLNYYQRSKKMAELFVLKAQKEQSLSLIVLRPHLIWGEDDPHFLPRLRERVKRGKLLQVGEGRNKVDVVHVDNAAYAHALAVKKIMGSSPDAKIYFVGDQHPVNLWDFISSLVQALGLSVKKISIPFSLAYVVGQISEVLYRLPLFAGKEPKITRFVALQLVHSHYFSQKRLRQDLDYQPIVSPSEGLDRIRNKSLER